LVDVIEVDDVQIRIKEKMGCKKRFW